MKLTLVEKRTEAEDTLSFFWKPEKKVKYLPGQFFYFTLPDLAYQDSRGPTRHFTLSSAPSEGDIISFTSRIRDESGYKQTLKKLKVGTKIEGEGPNGTFILDEKEAGPHVFLAGGIGITPFRSILKYHIDQKLNTLMHLIYSNKTTELIAFRKELEEWDKKYENIKVDIVISRPEESKEKWKGLKGRVDGQMIKKLVGDLSKPTFWITGPPEFVEAMEDLLGKIGISSDKVRSEKFTGY